MVGSVQAGQIQSSNLQIAREVIPDNTLQIVSPGAAYRFLGDIDARTNDQQFQIQFTLGGGELAHTAGALAAQFKHSISVTDGLSGDLLLQSEGTPITTLDPAVFTTTYYTVDAIGVSADLKTLFATITIKQDATRGLVKQPIVAFNTGTNRVTNLAAPTGLNAANGQQATVAANDKVKLTKLYDVVGSVPSEWPGNCASQKNLTLNVKHYVALSGIDILATDTTAIPDEHTRGGSTNSGTLIVFPTNVKVNFLRAGGNAKLAVGGTAFTGSDTAALDGSLAGGIDSWVATTAPSPLVNLGAIYLTQNGLGYDANLADQYLIRNLEGKATALLGHDTAAGSAGRVEAKQVDVTVTGSDGFAVGSVLSLNTNPNCGTATNIASATSSALTATTAALPVTLSIDAATLATTGTAPFGAGRLAPVYICYNNAAGGVIPASAFDAVGTIVKAPAVAASTYEEQNNVCGGPLYALRLLRRTFSAGSDGVSPSHDGEDAIAPEKQARWVSRRRNPTLGDSSRTSVYSSTNQGCFCAQLKCWVALRLPNSAFPSPRFCPTKHLLHPGHGAPCPGQPHV